MTKWQPIESARKDGSVIMVKRVFDGRIVYKGPAVWRTVQFGSLRDPITQEIFADERDATGWMRVDIDKRVPAPTHWMSPK